MFLLWTALAVVFATQLYFAGLPWNVALAWTLPRWYSWGLLTPGGLLARSAARAKPRRCRCAWPCTCRSASPGPRWRFSSGWPRGRCADRPFPTTLADYFLDRFYSDLLIYAVIAGVSFSRHYADAGEARTRAGARTGALRPRTWNDGSSKSQLQSLRAQLQPHFLFNALNTISAFTETNPQMARRLMAQLGDLLRASLRHAAQPLVTLGEELTFLDDFLAIESARFEGRLHVSRATPTTICCR